MSEVDTLVNQADIFATTPHAVPNPMDAINALGLSHRILELELNGYCVIPAEEVGADDLTRRAREVLLRISEDREGVVPDTETGLTHAMEDRAFGQLMYQILLDDPVYEEILTHPVTLAFTRYLLGHSAKLSAMSGVLRGPGCPALPLHADLVMVPPPFPQFAQVSNATWILSDYSKDNGATCFWPGSHKLCRRPNDLEIADISQFVPVEAPAGSLIVWHGNTWHGSFAKVTPGLRMQLIMYFCRTYMFPQEWYPDKISQEALDRNGPDFAEMLYMNHAYPFPATDEGGPNWSKIASAFTRLVSLEA